MSMELIETIEVGAGGASSIEFTSIPQDGVDLLCVVSARNSWSAADRTAVIAINGSTADKSGIKLQGNGSSVSSGSNVNFTVQAATTTANTFTSVQLYFSNYTSSSNKSFAIEQATENNATAVEHLIQANLWSQTSAITSLGFSFGDGNFVEYSTASLYKIY